jgi:hypothetical protein
MVFRGRLDGVEAAASLKNTSVSLAVGPGYVVAWDLGGRIYSVFKGGHTFRRGLSGRVLHKWRDAEASPEAAGPYDERQRVVLPEAESDRLLDESAALAGRALQAIGANRRAWRDAAGGTPGMDLTDALAVCARFDATAARADAARFARVYSPIGILPPDQYLSVVVQATSGCSFGTCTFCDLYHAAYEVKTPAQFSRHLADVRDYLGASLALRGQSVFLGAANALAVPMPRLIELLGVLRDAFADAPRAVHAFVDGFTGARKDAASYRQLAVLGLARVYIGLESGHDPLLAFVRKPGTSAQAVETVRAIKAAGVSAGVIVMIGLGGHRFAAGHIADTAAALNAMGLGRGDLIYFSDLVEVAGTAYPEIASATDLRPLSLGNRIAQLRALRSALAFPGEPPKFARYDIREFVY